MTRPAGERPNIASRTTFDALAVEIGEESEEEDVQEVASLPETLVSSHTCPVVFILS